jgi:aspartyl protease family protein
MRKHVQKSCAALAGVVVVALFIFTSAPRAAAAEAKSPEDVLKTKGLTKLGPLYIIDEDLHLTDSLKAIRKAESEVEAYAARRKLIQGDIDAASSKILRYRKDIAAINDQMANTKKSNARDYNALVNQLNARGGLIEESDKFIERRTADLQRLIPPTADPIGATFELADKLETASTKYDELSKDSDVANAIATLAAASRIKPRLGPTEQFKSELARLRKQRGTLNATMVKCERYGGVMHVHATINGSTPVTMVVDSGAGVVTLSDSVAKQLKIEAKPDDPDVTLNIANGKEVHAKLVKLDSIRIGAYVAKDVVAALMPDTGSEVDCLLGESFLQNFIFRLDIAAGVLHLSPISGQSNVIVDPTAADNTAPTLRGPATARSAARVTLEISATVDVSAGVDVTADGLKWKHSKYKAPSEVRVNGQTWDPQANPNFTAPEIVKLLQSVDFDSARSVEKKGRGIIAMEPQEDRLAVYFIDLEAGADHYSIKISMSEK